MRRPDTTAVELLEPEAADDARLTERLARLVNDVYAVAEAGLWRDGADRTTTAEIAGLVRAGEIAVATRDGEIAGAVRVHDVADDVSEFGMLVADPAQRGTGVGRALVEFAEERSRARGMRAMQLELLLPRTGTHPSKELLRDWYGRIGYRRIGTGSIEDTHPQLAPLLATPCDLAVFEKPLGT